MRNHQRMTVTEAAERVGVTTKTLIRWEESGKVPPVKRDWRGWRVYTPSDVRRLVQFHEALR